MNKNIFYALLAAMLFGASTPFAKLLIGELSPVLLGGLLYLGSGIGLALIRLIRDRQWKIALRCWSEWRWLLSATFFGGVLAPIALLFGLSYINGSTASLLLNLEAVLTAMIAWFVFKENVDWRNVLGMLAIVGGGIVLSLPEEGTPLLNLVGVFAVTVACLCWSIDNNLTRKVSSSDAVFIAATKGLIAGVVNTAVALSFGAVLPDTFTLANAMLLGLFGYGISLVLFVLALRGLGTARTGAYFSTAPFVGAAVSLVLLDEPTSPMFWIASALMALGVGLHLTEKHDHPHTHTQLNHSHRHEHDEHHQHKHDFVWNERKPHVHAHIHSEIKHQHSHFPDIHHRHNHKETKN